MPIGSPLMTGFIPVGGLATFRFLTRPNRVHLRCGSRVCPYQGFTRWIARILCSLGYMYEQAIYMVNTFQFTRSARLILAHRLKGAVLIMGDNISMLRKMKSLRCSAVSLALLAASMLASVVALTAQSGRSYSAGHVWWNANEGGVLPWEEAYDNPDGELGIWNKAGAVHAEGHPFFTRLGANGRACVTCHQPSDAMSVSAASLRERWNETQGKDPVFAAIDGSNCPDLPQALMSSHSLLLERGLFRISLPWPPKDSSGTAIRPEFRIEVVRDPTGCNSGPVYGLDSVHPAISVYRRPRVVGNFSYLIAGPSGPSFMADGREPSLRSQAITAAMVHEQADTQPAAEQLQRIIDFETQLYVAQSTDIRGGRLNEPGGPAALGPENLSNGRATNLVAGFDAWRKPKGGGDLGLQHEFRASVARGSDVFFARTFTIRDAFPVNRIGNLVEGSCATCHNTAMTRWMDIGTANHATAKESSPELPLFRITCDSTASAASIPGARNLYSGPRARVDLGQVLRRRLHRHAAIQGAGRACPLFLERLGAEPACGGGVLRAAVWLPVQRTREAGPGELPQRPVILRYTLFHLVLQSPQIVIQ